MNRTELENEGKELAEALFARPNRLSDKDRRAKRTQLANVIEQINALDAQEKHRETLHNIVMRGLQQSTSKRIGG